MKREPYQIPQPQQIKGAKKKAEPSTLSCESSQLQQKEKQQSGKKKYFQWVTATRYLNNFTGEHCRSHYHLFTAIQHIPPFPSLVTSCSLAPKPHFLSQTPDQLQLVFSSFLPEFLGYRQDHFEKENRIRYQNRRLKNYPQLKNIHFLKTLNNNKNKRIQMQPKKEEKRKKPRKERHSIISCRRSNIPSAALGDQRLDSILNGECNHEHPCSPRLLLLLRRMLLLLTRHILLLRHHNSFVVIVAVVVVLSSDRRCRNPASSSYCYKQREQVSKTRFVQKQKLGLHVVDKFRVTNFQRR